MPLCATAPIVPATCEPSAADVDRPAAEACRAGEAIREVLALEDDAIAMTATAVAERYGIPFVVGDSVAADITGRSFKTVFRTTPIASDLARTYIEFLT